jgi:2-iminobutanoate/2-iminopropanoate deaminase
MYRRFRKPTTANKEWAMGEVQVTGRTPRGHYSNATTHNGLIFTAGMLPTPANGSSGADMSFEKQVRQVLENLLDVLKAAGAGPQDVLKMTAYIVGAEHWAPFNKIYAEVFGEHKPARTVLPVPELYFGYLVEVEAIAAARA